MIVSLIMKNISIKSYGLLKSVYVLIFSLAKYLVS